MIPNAFDNAAPAKSFSALPSAIKPDTNNIKFCGGIKIFLMEKQELIIMKIVCLFPIVFLLLQLLIEIVDLVATNEATFFDIVR